MVEIIISSTLSGCISAIAIISVLKTDISWLKKSVENLEKRMTYIERKI